MGALHDRVLLRLVLELLAGDFEDCGKDGVVGVDDVPEVVLGHLLRDENDGDVGLLEVVLEGVFDLLGVGL